MNKTNHPSLALPGKREMAKLYNVEKKSTWEIAKVYGTSQTQIRRWFVRLGIRARTYSESASITRNGKSGKEHHMWKGDKVGYQALHVWVRRYKGTPQKCEHCLTTEPRKYEWANVSKKYKRDLNDWIRLCTSCHRKYDNSKSSIQ